ncbi:hypothetical protein BK026_19055 [Alteromonas sp. V450]|nr:hypothetical protein BK026_19055 [Alteromonas sp. V450]
MQDVQLERKKGKGPTHGRVARTGRCESRWKGAYTDFNREDFSRKGSRRRILKIPRKRGAGRFPFFLKFSLNRANAGMAVPFQIPRMKLGSLPDLPKGRV